MSFYIKPAREFDQDPKSLIIQLAEIRNFVIERNLTSLYVKIT